VNGAANKFAAGNLAITPERRQLREEEPMQDATIGILLLVAAGIMNASFTLPMKFTQKWAWENTWTVWTVCALLILPTLAALLTIPNLGTVYKNAGAQNVIMVASCGLAWGIAQVLFGLAVHAIGIALGFAIVLGLSAAIGSLIPLIRLHPEKIFTPAGFAAIVRDGALVNRGMPQFAELSDAQLDSLRHYVRAKARESRAK